MNTLTTTAAPQVLDVASMPLVGLDSMNQTHREELELVNRLGRLLDQEPILEDGIDAGLEAWIAHTREHFAGENVLMQTHRFPAYTIHSGEHARVLAELEQVQRHWLAERNLSHLRDYVYDAWPQWFLRHVKTMDTVTAAYLVPLD